MYAEESISLALGNRRWRRGICKSGGQLPTGRGGCGAHRKRGSCRARRSRAPCRRLAAPRTAGRGCGASSPRARVDGWPLLASSCVGEECAGGREGRAHTASLHTTSLLECLSRHAHSGMHGAPHHHAEGERALRAGGEEVQVHRGGRQRQKPGAGTRFCEESGADEGIPQLLRLAARRRLLTVQR